MDSSRPTFNNTGSNPSTTFEVSNSSTTFVASNPSTTSVTLNSSTTSVASNPSTTSVIPNTLTSFVVSSPPASFAASNSSNSTLAITSPNTTTTLSFPNPLSFPVQITESGSPFSNSVNRIPSTSLNFTTTTFSLSKDTNTFSCVNSTTTTFTFQNPSTTTFAFQSPSTTAFALPNTSTIFAFSLPTHNIFTFTNSKSSNSATVISSPKTRTKLSVAKPAKSLAVTTAKNGFSFSNFLDRRTSTDFSSTTTTFSLSNSTTSTSSCLNPTTAMLTFQNPSSTTFPVSCSNPVTNPITVTNPSTSTITFGSPNEEPTIPVSNSKPCESQTDSKKTFGIAHRMEDCKISLSEMPKNNLSSVNYRIEVPNFFTLPEFEDTECVMNSPSFKFARASWEFSFISKNYFEDSEKKRVKRCGVYLNQLKAEEWIPNIFYTILLLDSNYKVHDSYSSTEYIYEHFPEAFLYSFTDNKSFYDRRDTLTLIIQLICKMPPDVNEMKEQLSINTGIAERRNYCRISLCELPLKEIASINYMITITNVSSPFEHYNEFKSPSFSFANATWQFNFKSEKKLLCKSRKCIKKISIYLTRLNSEIHKHLIFFKTSRAISETNGVLTFDESEENRKFGYCIGSFDNDNNRAFPIDTLNILVHLICEDSPEINAVPEQLSINKGVTHRKKNCEISLSKLPRKRLSSVNFKIKIPNFFTLPEYDNTEFKVNGPSFEFATATWQFIFESDCTNKVNRFNKDFRVLLMRLKSEVRKHSIITVISLLTENDKNYHECRNGHVYDETDITHFICTFSNENPLYDRRDTLTLLIHLICDESSEVNVVRDLFTTNRGKYLRQDYKDVLLNGENHNLTFNVQGKEFRAHQDILKARSEVFRSMLNHDMLEKNSGNINVPDCDPEAFQQFLLYVYTGNVESLDENNMFGLYYAADKYNMPYLMEECREFIKNSLSVFNICEVIQLASKHTDRNMLECAINYFINNADDIFPTVKWQMFLEENPTVANELIIKSFKKLKLKTSS